jgi:hypothetical protein
MFACLGHPQYLDQRNQQPGMLRQAERLNGWANWLAHGHVCCTPAVCLPAGFAGPGYRRKPPHLPARS